MVEITSGLSRRLSNAGFICACLVVAHHVKINTVVGSFANYWARYFSDGFCKIAVPLFFLFAGFFAAGRMSGAGWYAGIVKKRFKTLIIPYLVWTAIHCVFSMAMLIAMNFLAHRAIGENIWFWLKRIDVTLGINPFEQPVMSQLWFVRSLFIFVLMLPLLSRMANKAGVIILFVLYCLVHSVDIGYAFNFFHYFMSLEGIFYYVLGIYVRRNGFPKDLSLLWIIVAAIIGICLVEVNKAVAILLLAYAFWSCCTKVNIPLCLTSLSFPVYLIHGFFLTIYCNVLCRFVPVLQADSIVSWLIEFIFVLSLSVLTGFLLKRFSNLLFGGR